MKRLMFIFAAMALVLAGCATGVGGLPRLVVRTYNPFFVNAPVTGKADVFVLDDGYTPPYISVGPEPVPAAVGGQGSLAFISWYLASAGYTFPTDTDPKKKGIEVMDKGGNDIKLTQEGTNDAKTLYYVVYDSPGHGIRYKYTIRVCCKSDGSLLTFDPTIMN
jgi:hypothetical protein